MPALSTYIPGQVATVKPTANVRVAPTLTATIKRVVGSAGESWTVTGWVTGEVDPDGGSNQWVTRWNDGWEYTAKSNLTSGPAAPEPAPVPYPVKMTLTVGDKPVSVTAGPLTLP